MESAYVVCPHTVTSPVADEIGMEPNVPCGAKVPVVNLAAVMDSTCPRGHRFIATSSDVRADAVAR